jgi:hypothetical protein
MASDDHQADVRHGSDSDIATQLPDVRFTPKSGHSATTAARPFCAMSGPVRAAHAGAERFSDRYRRAISGRTSPRLFLGCSDIFVLLFPWLHDSLVPAINALHTSNAFNADRSQTWAYLRENGSGVSNPD